MFSLGASIYELCLGRSLGAGGDDGMAEWHNIRDGVLSVDFDYHYSNALTDLIRRLLHADPTTRPSALEVISLSAGRIGAAGLEGWQKMTKESNLVVSDSQIAALLAENDRLRTLLMSTASSTGSTAPPPTSTHGAATKRGV